MKKLYIIKVGSTFSSALETLGNIDDWVTNALGALAVLIEVVDVKQQSPLPSPEECNGADQFCRTG